MHIARNIPRIVQYQEFTGVAGPEKVTVNVRCHLVAGAAVDAVSLWTNGYSLVTNGACV